jgi:hypothetical protein
MGYCERSVEAQLGGGAVCLFLNGAEGDVSPNQFGLAGAAAMGTAIATHALALAPRAAAAASGDPVLASSLEVVRFPARPALRFDKLQGALPAQVAGQVNLAILQNIFKAVQVEMDDDWFGRDVPFQAIRIDDAVLLGVPGEPLTAVGLDLKARARALGFARPVVVGLANDHVGYIADPIEYDLGGYEAMMTFFGRDESLFVADGMIRRAAQIKP